MTDTDTEVKQKSSPRCSNCGDGKRSTDCFGAPAFDLELVCVQCVGEFLQKGEWP